ncbi:MAG: hypothetical protein JWP18_1970 [Solirubrobacterales bacterium]|nr:hypothetical protein [Solirubrobacterales bacterium]
MHARRRRHAGRAGAAGLLAALAVTGLAPAPATAASPLKVGIADDAQMLYQGPEAAARAAAAFGAMGIDSVRLHARWAFIAPRPNDRSMPAGFDPRDPGDPQYAFGNLDRAVALLEAQGIEPLIAITGSGPVWTSADPKQDNPLYKPDPAMFGDFAHAVAERYKGRVRQYVVWNEPNQPAFLQPQFSCSSSGCKPLAPHLYRELYRAAATAVRAADPAAQVLIGALAPRGKAPRSRNATMRPLQFLRALGCVTTSYKRDRTGACRTAKPVTADGFAYHPHPVGLRPDQHDAERDNASIGDIDRIQTALDRTTSAGVVKPVSGKRLDLYFTEFGYQTNPPDPTVGIPTSRQAAWVQWASYLAWRHPRVKTLTQYEWIDEPVKTASRSLDKYAGWQSGILFADGRPKPLAAAFPNPFFVDVLPKGKARFWGQVRPGGATRVVLQQRSGSAWKTVTERATDARGYWSVVRSLPKAGKFRFTYPAPATGPGELPVTTGSLSQSVTPRR